MNLGLGFRVLGFRVWDLGFRVSGFRVWGLGFRPKVCGGLGFVGKEEWKKEWKLLRDQAVSGGLFTNPIDPSLLSCANPLPTNIPNPPRDSTLSIALDRPNCYNLSVECENKP